MILGNQGSFVKLGKSDEVSREVFVKAKQWRGVISGYVGPKGGSGGQSSLRYQ